MRTQLIKFLAGIVFVVSASTALFAQDAEMVRHFDYDKNAPLDLKIVATQRAREYAKVVSEPKRLKLYEAPHSLNAEARRDRVAFLVEQLKLKPVPEKVLAAVPDLYQPPRQD